LSGSSVLPERSEKEQATVLLQLETSKIYVSGVNVRRTPGEVGELMQSIKEKGILEPLLVRPVDGRYELIVGSRRFEAAKRLGLKRVPTMVKSMPDEEALIISLVENIQRKAIEPEEEYDALMKLKKLNPILYSANDDLARAIGKSRQYVEDHINAVQTVRAIRKTAKSDIAVKHAPTQQERREGVLPIKHATLVHRAGESPAVQRIPEERRARKLSALAETIAQMPQPEAERVVEHFVMAPQRPMEEIKRESETLRSVKLQVILDPRVADALRRSAEERATTMEAMASLAIHSWLRQNKYY
jgi:ParB/RepB/Spo0J family partition protein